MEIGNLSKIIKAKYPIEFYKNPSKRYKRNKYPFNSSSGFEKIRTNSNTKKIDEKLKNLLNTNKTNKIINTEKKKKSNFSKEKRFKFKKNYYFNKSQEKFCRIVEKKIIKEKKNILILNKIRKKNNKYKMIFKNKKNKFLNKEMSLPNLGPGSYNPILLTNYKNILNWEKTISNNKKKSENDFPGPGAYKIKNFNKFSKIKKRISHHFSLSSNCENFKKLDKKNEKQKEYVKGAFPGPGFYSLKNEWKKDKKNFTNNKKNDKGKIIKIKWKKKKDIIQKNKDNQKKINKVLLNNKNRDDILEKKIDNLLNDKLVHNMPNTNFNLTNKKKENKTNLESDKNENIIKTLNLSKTINKLNFSKKNIDNKNCNAKVKEVDQKSIFINHLPRFFYNTKKDYIGPGNYNLKSSFDEQKKKVNLTSYGFGTNQNRFESINESKKFPGPGNYETKNFFKTKSSKYIKKKIIKKNKRFSLNNSDLKKKLSIAKKKSPSEKKKYIKKELPKRNVPFFSSSSKKIFSEFYSKKEKKPAPGEYNLNSLSIGHKLEQLKKEYKNKKKNENPPKGEKKHSFNDKDNLDFLRQLPTYYDVPFSKKSIKKIGFNSSNIRFNNIKEIKRINFGKKNIILKINNT